MRGKDSGNPGREPQSDSLNQVRLTTNMFLKQYHLETHGVGYQNPYLVAARRAAIKLAVENGELPKQAADIYKVDSPIRMGRTHA